MANKKHVELLKQGVDTWNAWRKANPGTQPDLESADLASGQFEHIDFSGARLLWSKLCKADLRKANLRGAHLSSANLTDADLRQADLSTTRIHRANLARTLLHWSDFRAAYLAESDFTEAVLWETVFSDTNLTDAKGLDSCMHVGPSTVDHRTVVISKGLPKSFLVACGYPAKLADCLVETNPVSFFYRSFISYSSADTAFVHKLYNDLLNNGVNCWLDSEELTPGVRLWDALAKELAQTQRVILVCSTSSLSSPWVEDEVNKTFSEERKRKYDLIVPLRIDRSILDTAEPWAEKLRDSRYIADFSMWEDSSQYGRSLEKLLQALRLPSS